MNGRQTPHLRPGRAERQAQPSKLAAMKATADSGNTVVPFASPEGQALFTGTPHDHINWRVIECAVPQANACFCGPAAVVTALLATRKAGSATVTDQFALFTRNGHASAEPVCTLEQVLGRAPRTWAFDGQRIEATYAGMSMEEVEACLAGVGRAVELTYASAQNDWETHFGEVISLTPDQPVLINFDGSTLGLPLGGHFAVIAGHGADRRRLLIADPARHKVGWYWVDAADLYRAMLRPRPTLERPRGWLAVGH